MECMSERIAALLVLVLAAIASPLASVADDGGSLAPAAERGFREPSLPSGAPFSLNAYDAVHALYLLRAQSFVIERSQVGADRIIPVRQVRSLRLADAENPLTPFERRRYDILLNGERINWEVSFIEWGGRMVNLRVLYTYRNGALPEGLTYQRE